MKKFLLPFQNTVRVDLFSGSLAVWNVAAEPLRIYSPPLCEPHEARRANSVRAILRIHRNSGFRKWKDTASRRETRRSDRI